MNYIVDPSWVYWMNVADAIKCVVLVVGGTFGLISIIAIPITLDCNDWEDVRKWAIPFIVSAPRWRVHPVQEDDDHHEGR